MHLSTGTGPGKDNKAGETVGRHVLQEATKDFGVV